MTFERVLEALEDLVLIRFWRDRTSRVGPRVAVLPDELADGHSRRVDGIQPPIDLDLLLPCPCLGTAFRPERFCYTLPSLAFLGTPATAYLQD